MFYFIDTWETANYAYDTTPYMTGATIADVISSVKASLKILFKWFDDNYVKTNSNKSHPILSSESDVDVTKNINADIISNSKLEKPFGVIIDCKLIFDEYVLQSCGKTSQTLGALARISSFMNPVQKK